MKSNLNIILQGFIYFLIVCNAITLLSSAILMQNASDATYFTTLWTVVYTVVMIVALLNLLKIKKVALYQYGGLQLINAVLQCVIFGKPILDSLFIAVGVCLIMAIMLCIRKNGVSAWQLLLQDKSKLINEVQINSCEIKIPVEDKTGKIDNHLLKNEEKRDVEVEIDEVINEGESKIAVSNNTTSTPTLASLPYNDDGSIDYDRMTTEQQFAYTCKMESVEVAIMDLDADIEILEKSIHNIKKELSLQQGVNRIKLRDFLRNEQDKLIKLQELRKKYTNNDNNASVDKRGSGAVILFGLVAILFVLCIIAMFIQE